MSIDAKSLVQSFLEEATTRYVQDLNALSDDLFIYSPGGAARSAADFTAECAHINAHLAALLRGETPEQLTRSGWMRASGDELNKTIATAKFLASGEALKSAFGSVSEENLGDAASGQFAKMNLGQLGHFAAKHINYHDAQLNYLQSIHGDEEMHWF